MICSNLLHQTVGCDVLVLYKSGCVYTIVFYSFLLLFHVVLFNTGWAGDSQLSLAGVHMYCTLKVCTVILTMVTVFYLLQVG